MLQSKYNVAKNFGFRVNDPVNDRHPVNDHFKLKLKKIRYRDFIQSQTVFHHVP